MSMELTRESLVPKELNLCTKAIEDFRTGTVDGIMLLTFTPLEGYTDVVMRFLPPEMRPTDFDEEYQEF